MSTIKVCYTRTYQNQPLVGLDGGPFNNAELTPERLRAIAVLLMDVAEKSEQRPCTGRRWAPAKSIVTI